MKIYELSLPLTKKLYRHHIELIFSTDTVDNVNLHQSLKPELLPYENMGVYSTEHCAANTELGLQQHLNQEYLNCTSLLFYPGRMALLLTQ